MEGCGRRGTTVAWKFGDSCVFEAYDWPVKNHLSVVCIVGMEVNLDTYVSTCGCQI